MPTLSLAQTPDDDDLSPLPEHVQAQQGHKRKSRAFRRGRAKQRQKEEAAKHHDAAKTHLESAQHASTPKEAHAHLFRALSSLKKAL